MTVRSSIVFHPSRSGCSDSRMFKASTDSPQRALSSLRMSEILNPSLKLSSNPKAAWLQPPVFMTLSFCSLRRAPDRRRGLECTQTESVALWLSSFFSACITTDAAPNRLSISLHMLPSLLRYLNSLAWTECTCCWRCCPATVHVAPPPSVSPDNGEIQSQEKISRCKEGTELWEICPTRTISINGKGIQVSLIWINLTSSN